MINSQAEGINAHVVLKYGFNYTDTDKLYTFLHDEVQGKCEI